MTNSHWQQAVGAAGQKLPAALILIAALVLIQFGSGAAKILMTTENAPGLAFWRLLLGGAFMWLFIWPPVRQFDRQQWLDVGLLGVIYAMFNVTVYKALANLPLGLVATIGFLGPLIVSATATSRLRDLAWPLLGFAGVCMLAPSAGEADVSWIGIGWAFGYATCWGLYILASARAGKSVNGLDGFVVATLFAAVVIAPWGLPHAAGFVSSPQLAIMTLLVVLLVTIPFAMEFVALKRIKPRVFGVLLSLEPAIASVIGIILLQEWLPPSGWLAIAAVTGASLGATLTRETQRSPREGIN